jgi:hypothetical protein
MANRSVIVSFITKLNAKGLKQAESGFKKMGKSALQAGKASKIGFLLSGTAAVAFAGKQMGLALKAVQDQDKELRLLEQTLRNVGSAFTVKEVDGFVDSLERAFGVAGDELVPALNQLINVTGDVTASQELLKIALDVSKGSGKDLATVSAALSRAFSGNLTALGRLNVGLDKSTLASGDLDGAILELSQKFAGQATNAVGGFAGQLDKLRISGEKAQENLGTGLVEALKILAGDRPGGMANLGGQLENIGTRFGNVAMGAADFARDAKGMIKPILAVIAVLTPLGRIIAVVGLALKLFEKRGAKVKAERDALKSTLDIENKRDQASAGRTQTVTKIVKLTASQLALQKKLQDQEKKLNAEKNKERAKKLEEERRAKTLADLEAKFDIEGINLAKAKNRAKTSEEINAVEGLQAIRSAGYKDDEAALNKIMALEKGRIDQVKTANEELAKTKIVIPIEYQIPDISGAFRDRISSQLMSDAVINSIERSLEGLYPTPRVSPSQMAEQAQRVAGLQEQARSSPEYASLANAMSGFQSATFGSGLGADGLMGASNLPDFSTLALGQDASGMTIVVNVAGSVSTENDLVSAIATGLNNLQRSGQPITLANQGR